MSDIWILEVDDTSHGEVNRYHYATSGAAEKEAAYEIMERISQKWEIYGDQREAAEEINNAVAADDYKKAIRLFNLEEENANHPFFIVVVETLLHTYKDAQQPNLLEFEDDEEEEEEETPVSSGPYIASTPGATCRGPCKNHSTDAYADSRDGTYECYSCKLMKGVFGS